MSDKKKKDENNVSLARAERQRLFLAGGNHCDDDAEALDDKFSRCSVQEQNHCVSEQSCVETDKRGDHQASFFSSYATKNSNISPSITSSVSTCLQPTILLRQPRVSPRRPVGKNHAQNYARRLTKKARAGLQICGNALLRQGKLSTIVERREDVDNDCEAFPPEGHATCDTGNTMGGAIGGRRGRINRTRSIVPTCSIIYGGSMSAASEKDTSEKYDSRSSSGSWPSSVHGGTAHQKDSVDSESDRLDNVRTHRRAVLGECWKCNGPAYDHSLQLIKLKTNCDTPTTSPPCLAYPPFNSSIFPIRSRGSSPFFTPDSLPSLSEAIAARHGTQRARRHTHKDDPPQPPQVP